MTGEEMEIVAGSSHLDQAEDIDIDLNYTSGQMDDDVMLGDYDQTVDAQHSPEVGDEQMAEGDDASYGMVDADEIDYNEVADPANDPDIEIGGTDDNSWQPESVAMEQELGDAQASVDEVDFAIVPDANDVEVQDATEISSEVWLEGQTSNVADLPPATAQISSTSEAQKDSSIDIEIISSNADHTEVSKGNLSPAASNYPPASSTAPQEQGTQQSNTEEEHRYEAHEEHQYEPQEELHDEYQETHHDEYQDDHQEEHNEEHLEEYPEEYNEGFEEVVKEVGEDNQEQEGAEMAASEIVGADATDEGPEPSTDLHHLESGEPDGGDDVENAQATDEWAGENLGVSDEVQAGVDSHETAKFISLANSASAEDDNAGESKAVGPLPHPQITATEDPSAIAARYDIVVQYGDSDYQLFAKSTEDDPNRYFLSDRSTLDLPLADFLSSIREVIAQELSPLDELVMSIDGLGVEFAETTTRDFIERYTFGDMLVLYDNLASNDDADFKPDIHIVLQVRPNCSQRLAALVDQANSGRGLSDVALYRDSPQLNDDFDEDFEEYEEDEFLAITPEPENDEYHDDVDEADNDNQEQQTLEYTKNDEQDQHSDTQEVNGQSGDTAKSPGKDETEVANVDETDVANVDEADVANVDEADVARVDEVEVANTDDDLLNGNDELDLGPTKQGNTPFFSTSPTVPCTGTFSECLCDDCFFHDLSDGGNDYQPGLSSPGVGQSCFHGTASAPGHASQSKVYQHTVSFTKTSDANSKRSQDQPSSNETQDHPINPDDEPLPQNGHGSDASSHNTSVTATLNGDDQDEIDYSDDEDGDDQDAANSIAQDQVTSQENTAPTKSQTAVDDEITWESEDEDAGEAANTTPSKLSAQVSPTTGKRTRSASNAADDEAPPSAKPRLS
ncbi:conserved glutamic acid-rich protein [Apiospora rasikravindrae]|uniref:Conserved glutamic acid-rich protein n=1 Tax=Apiospora rasikravindrae TaxID=990691 RepID=A0ABR1RW44_9PEZI